MQRGDQRDFPCFVVIGGGPIVLVLIAFRCREGAESEVRRVGVRRMVLGLGLRILNQGHRIYPDDNATDVSRVYQKYSIIFLTVSFSSLPVMTFSISWRKQPGRQDVQQCAHINSQTHLVHIQVSLHKILSKQILHPHICA